MWEEVGKQQWLEIPPSKVPPQRAEVPPGKEGLGLTATYIPGLSASPVPLTTSLLPVYSDSSEKWVIHTRKTIYELGNQREVVKSEDL